ncbi:hypothetical protein OK016_19720 [Vibrio chagasii]|nr:hypothetical protein [Vibrio chagasii]
MFSVDDRVVATKGVELGEMVVTGLSAGGYACLYVTTVEGNAAYLPINVRP